MKVQSLVLQAFVAANTIQKIASQSVSCISTKEELKYAIANVAVGATLPLCEGTYTFNKGADPGVMTLTTEGVTLTCVDVEGVPSQACVLDGGSLTGRKSGILDVQADSFAVSGITFQNAESALPGSALHVVGNGSGAYIIKDCAFLNNKVTGSGGAPVEIQTCVGCTQSGTLIIEDCLFSGNENTVATLAYGGALSAGNFENAFMERCTFTLNRSALETGGADFETIKNLKISDCSFSENYSSVYNGGLDVSLCENVEIDGCSFNMNEAGQWAGGVNIEETANVVVSNSTFTGNKDSCQKCEEGASALGAYLVGSLVVKDSSFLSNDSMGWGALCASEVQSVIIEDTLIHSNSAVGGGGIYTDQGASLSVTNCHFSMNVAKSDCGGGVQTYLMDSVLYDNACFEMNQAPDGGAGCSWDDGKSVTFESVMSHGGGDIAVAKDGCSDFSFPEMGKCVKFPLGQCSSN